MSRYAIIVIIVLIFINVWSLCRYSSLIDATTDIRIEKADSLRTLLKHFDLQQHVSIHNNGIQLSHLVVKDILKEVCELSDVFSNNNIDDAIVCRISNSFCNSCNEEIVKLLLESIEQFTPQNIIFLCTCQESRFIPKFINNYKLNGYKVYFVDEHILPADEIGFPYYVVLDDVLRVKYIYMPSKATINIDRIQLNNMIHYCFNKRW